MSTALIIVDIQNNYFQMETGIIKPDKGATNAAKLLISLDRTKMTIFYISHITGVPALGFFLPGTEGAEIHETVQPLETKTLSSNISLTLFKD